jgi:ribosomal protein S18 acetylase RimI-like enzyme
MTIRKATHSETKKILSHSLDVLKEATMGFVEARREIAFQMVSPFLSDGGYYLVFTENHVIQGWIGVGRTIDFYSKERIGIIPEVYVLPHYRKQGVAEKLCEEALRQLQKKGYKKVQLNVFSGNHAKHLYQNLGFQEVSTLMEKNLNLDS